MTSQSFLVLLRHGEIVERLAIGRSALHVGRSPGNHLVLRDRRVSWHHLVIWTDAQTIWLFDLRSTNGTWVDGRAVDEPRVIGDGDEIDVGRAAVLRVEGTPQRAALWVIDDQHSGLRHVVDRAWFVVGPSPCCDLCVPEADDQYVLVFREPDEVWLHQETARTRLAFSAPVQIAGRTLRFQRCDDAVTATAETEVSTCSDVVLEVEGCGTSSMCARVTDEVRGVEHVVTAPNRVVLLYLLAQSFRRDLDAGLDYPSAGWTDDEALIGGVWGFVGRERRRNSLHVLIHRARAELRERGIDPACIEKRDGFTRVRVREVVL